ncbi:Uncharacterised protein [BD1-7 clade bacterium]|uniref:DUF3995 domain-containing protein n=1 Tax=BD1-7 clade bacterium TaxID=2029982 RepID=A0A5S9QGB5_9GAMM|nr:Uncharacterised protein [BD1-7 clade bacterium]CAA0116498.1 Uncharacterised protein [BD1-7 clade bacterium]
MLIAKIILFISGAVWLGYGGWLFVDPKGLAYMGFGLDNWSAVVEVQAMYGAVEFMLGVFAMMGIINPKRYMHSALVVWTFIFAGLVVGRIVGIAQWGGDWWLTFGAEGLPAGYNPGALWFYEVPSLILCLIALKQTHKLPELN